MDFLHIILGLQINFDVVIFILDMVFKIIF